MVYDGDDDGDDDGGDDGNDDVLVAVLLGVALVILWVVSCCCGPYCCRSCCIRGCLPGKHLFKAWCFHISSVHKLMKNFMPSPPPPWKNHWGDAGFFNVEKFPRKKENNCK